jgi:hypothetical protein
MSGFANLGCFLVSHGDDTSGKLQEFTMMELAENAPPLSLPRLV